MKRTCFPQILLALFVTLAAAQRRIDPLADRPELLKPPDTPKRPVTDEYHGVKVTDDEMDAINILRHKFHGDWNYTITPQTSVRSDSS